MTHAEIAELLGAWALDAVDDDERQAVAAHLGIVLLWLPKQCAE